jgi:fluoroquinolone resistance protein
LHIFVSPFSLKLEGFLLYWKLTMQAEYHQDKTFVKANYTDSPLSRAEYEDCRFVDCDFSNSDLAGTRFVNCEFQSCNLTLAKLTKTNFTDVQFKGCKMLGLHFEHCSDFGFSVSFDNCMLDHSCFYKLKMKKTTFKDCKLQEVDFSEADLSNSNFDTCNLQQATFDNTILEKVDFRTSYNYTIDPERNRLKKAKFSVNEVRGLLSKYDILISD